MQPALVDQIIGAHIEQRRVKLGLKAADLAARLELGELDVLAYERGRRRFSASALLRFATALDCPAVALLNAPCVPSPRPAA